MYIQTSAIKKGFLNSDKLKASGGLYPESGSNEGAKGSTGGIHKLKFISISFDKCILGTYAKFMDKCIVVNPENNGSVRMPTDTTSIKEVINDTDLNILIVLQ